MSLCVSADVEMCSYPRCAGDESGLSYMSERVSTQTNKTLLLEVVIDVYAHGRSGVQRVAEFLTLLIMILISVLLSSNIYMRSSLI